MSLLPSSVVRISLPALVASFALAAPAMAAEPVTGSGLLDLPACGGLLAPLCPDEPGDPPSGGGLKVQIGASRYVVPTTQSITGEGKRVVIRGLVRGSSHPGGLEARLHESYPAYGLDNTRKGAVRRDGTVRFSARPAANARYRVSVSDGGRRSGASRPLGVFVVPDMSLDVGTGSEVGKAAFSVYTSVGSPVTLGAESEQPKSRSGRGFLYGVKGKRAHRLASMTVKPETSCSTYSCSARGYKELRATRKLSKFKGFITCLPRPVWIGFGAGYPGCGKGSVSLKRKG